MAISLPQDSSQIPLGEVVEYEIQERYYDSFSASSTFCLICKIGRSNEEQFVGYGEVGSITSSRTNPGQYTVIITNCREFLSPVSRRHPTLALLGAEFLGPRYLAIRQLDLELFNAICSLGGIELNTMGVDSEKVENSDANAASYDPSKIKVDRAQMSVFQVLRMIELGDLILNPDFQRNFVWDVVRRSRLIESALLGLPLPAFYFDGIDARRWAVIDGLQRLSTLHEFITNKSFQLEGLEYLSKSAGGKSFDGLPRGMQRDLEETQLTLFIIRPDTPPEVKFTIFYRINTGGLVLTAQEIRHALFQGLATKLLKRLASTDDFKGATDWGVSDSRMDARECVLRYLAFHLTPYDDYGKSDLNGFLVQAMKKINHADDSTIESLERSFHEAMVRARSVLGRNAFRKYNLNTGRRGPVNKALLEVWANVLQRYPLEKLIERRDKLHRLLGVAFEFDSDYSRSLSSGTGSRSTVQLRFERTHQIIQEALQ